MGVWFFRRTNGKNKEQETAVSLFEIEDKITLVSDTSDKNHETDEICEFVCFISFFLGTC